MTGMTGMTGMTAYRHISQIGHICHAGHICQDRCVWYVEMTKLQIMTDFQRLTKLVKFKYLHTCAFLVSNVQNVHFPNLSSCLVGHDAKARSVQPCVMAGSVTAVELQVFGASLCWLSVVGVS